MQCFIVTAHSESNRQEHATFTSWKSLCQTLTARLDPGFCTEYRNYTESLTLINCLHSLVYCRQRIFSASTMGNFSKESIQHKFKASSWICGPHFREYRCSHLSPVPPIPRDLQDAGSDCPSFIPVHLNT